MVQQHLNGRKGREGPVGAKSAGVLVPPSGVVVSPQKNYETNSFAIFSTSLTFISFFIASKKTF